MAAGRSKLCNGLIFSQTQAGHRLYRRSLLLRPPGWRLDSLGELKPQLEVMLCTLVAGATCRGQAGGRCGDDARSPGIFHADVVVILPKWSGMVSTLHTSFGGSLIYSIYGSSDRLL